MKHQPKPGRPTKLTEDTVNKIVAFVRAGNYPETAARACGIHPATFYRWKERGEEEPRGPYRSFFEQLSEAEAFAETMAIAEVREGRRGWQGRAWWLERKYFGRWGRRLAIVSQPDREPARLELVITEVQSPAPTVINTEGTVRLLTEEGGPHHAHNGNGAQANGNGRGP